jgi:branched-chain amino acid aminotransferase
MSTSFASTVAPIRSSRLAGVDFDDLPFSSVFSDHMTISHFEKGAWSPGDVQAYGPLALPPSISSLQYGLSVFEGLRVHRSVKGEILLFRPWENARRLNRSAARLGMPEVPEGLFLGSLKDLVSLDRDWVPPAGKGALYVRASLFSVDPSLRVRAAEQFDFVIFTSPFGAYYSAPVDALVESRYVRAFPGGTGDVKPAGNYAPTMLPEREAQAQGFNTVLWLDGMERRYVEECGVLNVFFVVGERVVTPSLSGTFLAGVTRDSALRLLRDAGWPVEERPIAIDEVVQWHNDGELRECFGTGTAALVSHVGRIRYAGEDLVLPPVADRKAGPFVRERLLGIMTGEAADPYGWVEVC